MAIKLSRREQFITMIYKEAMDLDCAEIATMMNAVGWTWQGKERSPNKEEVMDMLLDMCFMLSTCDTIGSMSGSYSGGFMYMVDTNVDEDGPWCRVKLAWGLSSVGSEYDGDLTETRQDVKVAKPANNRAVADALMGIFSLTPEGE